MINKNTENFAQELNLFPIHGNNIELSFNGDRISSDGGLLLLRELDSQINLILCGTGCINTKDQFQMKEVFCGSKIFQQLMK